MARLFLEPSELLLVIALVLLAAQSGRPSVDRLPLLLPLAWLLGGLIGLNLPAELLQAVACTAVLAATGLLVALGVRLRARVLLPLVALLAVLCRPCWGSPSPSPCGWAAAGSPPPPC